MTDKKIQWHQAFTAAVWLEFSENRDNLIYEKEYNLNTKPLEINLLVIKKQRHSHIYNEIGRLFRGHNILEYKSPEDHLNIDSFYKAIAYACLYKSYGETIDLRAEKTGNQGILGTGYLTVKKRRKRICRCRTAGCRHASRPITD